MLLVIAFTCEFINWVHVDTASDDWKFGPIKPLQYWWFHFEPMHTILSCERRVLANFWQLTFSERFNEAKTKVLDIDIHTQRPQQHSEYSFSHVVSSLNWKYPFLRARLLWQISLLQFQFLPIYSLVCMLRHWAFVSMNGQHFCSVSYTRWLSETTWRLATP